MIEYLIDQRCLRIVRKLLERVVSLPVVEIEESDFDQVVVLELRNLTLCVVRDRDVDGTSAALEQMERPQIESSAGKICPHRNPYEYFSHGVWLLAISVLSVPSVAGNSSSWAVRLCTLSRN